MTWLGHLRPARPDIVDGALVSRSPWGIDSNHAPPGGGYLHLLFILFTRAPADPGPIYGPLMQGNRFIDDNYPTDFRNARITARLKGNVNLRGAQLRLHCQAKVGRIAVNFINIAQPFEITPDWSEQTITLSTNPDDWLCIGARHDARDEYGCCDIEEVLRDVNIDIILLLHPLDILPLTPEPLGPHRRRPELDYDVDRSRLPEGVVMLDSFRIDFA